MSAEAEATDILVRMLCEGGEYALRITGTAATKGVGFAFAGIKLAFERMHGRQKLGGKITPRAFFEMFPESETYQIRTSDLKLIAPELKRLHIPYMVYRQTGGERTAGVTDIGIAAIYAKQFQRICESVGIGNVKPYDYQAVEVPADEIKETIESHAGRVVDFVVGQDGVVMDMRENPTSAPPDPSRQSEPGSNSVQTNSNSLNTTTQKQEQAATADAVAPPPMGTDDLFVPNAGINENLKRASLVASIRNGDIIPITASERLWNKDESDDKYLRITVPGTKGRERIKVPIEDVKAMPPNNSNIMIALNADKEYDIEVLRGARGEWKIRKETGAQIRDDGKWAIGFGSDFSKSRSEERERRQSRQRTEQRQRAERHNDSTPIPENTKGGRSK